MSITKISYKTAAWVKFLNQWLVPGNGGGYEEYRRILLEEHGLEMLIYEWKVFIIFQYFYGWISGDQYDKYMSTLPRPLYLLINVRKVQGTPSRVPLGCKLFTKGNKLQTIGNENKKHKKLKLEGGYDR